MLEEFKKFALRGNVVDLAIGVIIGAAFSKIVDSLVSDIIMPFFGALGGLDFSNYFIGLNTGVTSGSLDEAKRQGAVLAYGSFVTAALNFLIIAFVLFLVIKGLNKLQKKEQAKQEAAPSKPEDVVLLGEIRDLLKAKA